MNSIVTILYLVCDGISLTRTNSLKFVFFLNSTYLIWAYFIYQAVCINTYVLKSLVHISFGPERYNIILNLLPIMKKFIRSPTQQGLHLLQNSEMRNSTLTFPYLSGRSRITTSTGKFERG